MFTARNQVINKESESVEISMICHSSGNTSDTKDGKKYDVLNSEWPTDVARKLEQFEHHIDQNSVNDDVDTENDDNNDSLSTNHEAPNLEKGDKATSKNQKKCEVRKRKYKAKANI